MFHPVSPEFRAALLNELLDTYKDQSTIERHDSGRYAAFVASIALIPTGGSGDRLRSLALALEAMASLTFSDDDTPNETRDRLSSEIAMTAEYLAGWAARVDEWVHARNN